MDKTPEFSPRRQADLEPNIPGFNIHQYSDEFYRSHAQKATEDLVTFSSSMTPQWPIVVTYFDEARVLGESLWSMLRLLSMQKITTSMWYVFMDTKSAISYFNPDFGNSEYRDLTRPTVPYLIDRRSF